MSSYYNSRYDENHLYFHGSFFNPYNTLYISLNLNSDQNNDPLKDFYYQHVIYHNKQIEERNYPDSGFDIPVPNHENIFLNYNHTDSLKVDLKVKAVMYNNEKKRCVPFQIFARSSIYKTPLRLANSVGIIDSGYRGNLGIVLDKFNKTHDNIVTITPFRKMVQICNPSLEPFNVIILEEKTFMEHFGNTDRNSGGFGSTGT